MTAADVDPAARSLTDADVEALADALAERLRPRVRKARKRVEPAVEISETDRQAAFATARRLGLRVRGGTR